MIAVDFLGFQPDTELDSLVKTRLKHLLAAAPGAFDQDSYLIRTGENRYEGRVRIRTVWGNLVAAFAGPEPRLVVNKLFLKLADDLLDLRDRVRATGSDPFFVESLRLSSSSGARAVNDPIGRLRA
jgi:hypothetical protein